jgi:hypothetical protein
MLCYQSIDLTLSSPCEVVPAFYSERAFEAFAVLGSELFTGTASAEVGLSGQ